MGQVRKYWRMANPHEDLRLTSFKSCRKTCSCNPNTADTNATNLGQLRVPKQKGVAVAQTDRQQPRLKIHSVYCCNPASSLNKKQINLQRDAALCAFMNVFACEKTIEDRHEARIHECI